jgi:hypothetical protein
MGHHAPTGIRPKFIQKAEENGVRFLPICSEWMERPKWDRQRSSYSLCEFGAAALFVADAIVGFSRSARGIDDDAVSRRLANTGVGDTRPEPCRADPQKGRGPWLGRPSPLASSLAELVMQSGLSVRLERVLLLMAIFCAVGCHHRLFLPVRFSPAA